MNSEQLIGNRWVRAAGVVCALACAGAVGLNLAGGLSRGQAALRLTAWLAGFLAVLAGVHWSQSIYGRWMRAAGVLNIVATTLLLGACYFLIVPVFWAIVQLRHIGRTRGGRDSYWHERRPVDPDLRYFQRMG